MDLESSRVIQVMDVSVFFFALNSGGGDESWVITQRPLSKEEYFALIDYVGDMFYCLL